MVTKRRAKELSRLRDDAGALWSDQQDLLVRANGVLRDAGTQAGHLYTEEYGPRLQTAYTERLQPGVTRSAELATAVAKGAETAVFGTAVPAVSSLAAAATALGGTAKVRATDAAGRAATTATKVGASAKQRVDSVTKSGTKQKDAAVKALKGAAVVKGAKSLASKDTGDKVVKAAKGAAAVKAAKGLTDPKKRKAALKAAKGVAAVKVAQKTLPAKKKSGLGTGSVIGIVLGVLALVGIGYAVWQTLRADDDLWVADDEPEVAPGTDTPV